MDIASILGFGWFAFWAYWLISATQSKKTIRNRGLWKGALARLVLFIFIIFLITNTHTEGFFAIPHHLTPTAFDIVGIIIWLIGIGLAIWARAYLGKNWGMPMSLKENPELVTTGPYQYIRNPIYTGVIVAMFGSAFIEGAWWVIIFIFFAVYFTYAAVQEDKIMAQTFPDTYPAYRARTKMLIPFVL